MLKNLLKAKPTEKKVEAKATVKPVAKEAPKAKPAEKKVEAKAPVKPVAKKVGDEVVVKYTGESKFKAGVKAVKPVVKADPKLAESLKALFSHTMSLVKDLAANKISVDTMQKNAMNDIQQVSSMINSNKINAAQFTEFSQQIQSKFESLGCKYKHSLSEGIKCMGSLESYGLSVIDKMFSDSE